MLEGALLFLQLEAISQQEEGKSLALITGRVLEVQSQSRASNSAIRILLPTVSYSGPQQLLFVAQLLEKEDLLLVAPVKAPGVLNLMGLL